MDALFTSLGHILPSGLPDRGLFRPGQLPVADPDEVRPRGPLARSQPRLGGHAVPPCGRQRHRGAHGGVPRAGEAPGLLYVRSIPARGTALGTSGPYEFATVAEQLFYIPVVHVKESLGRLDFLFVDQCK